MSKKYSVKLSVTLTNKDISVLKSALSDFILTTPYKDNADTAKALLELINNVDKKAKRQLNSPG